MHVLDVRNRLVRARVSDRDVVPVEVGDRGLPDGPGPADEDDAHARRATSSGAGNERAVDLAQAGVGGPLPAPAGHERHHVALAELEGVAVIAAARHVAGQELRELARRTEVHPEDTCPDRTPTPR